MLALTVPGLLAADMRSVKTLAPLQTLARYADPPALHKNGIGEALLATLGLDAATPLAPLCAQGAGIDAHRYIVGATPVTLTADRDIVVLERRVDDLDAEDSATLIDLLNRHFADDALQFVAPRPSTWFIESTRTFSFSTFAL
ncbi:MAG TPA: hypothetical protein VJ032_10040, partial [Thermoanaerobaculia bacterium]|nr:hypothetical protein [Thermoanaerobaculia bacterium]